jgi:hypothetical protein
MSCLKSMLPDAHIVPNLYFFLTTVLLLLYYRDVRATALPQVHCCLKFAASSPLLAYAQISQLHYPSLASASLCASNVQQYLLNWLLLTAILKFSRISKEFGYFLHTQQYRLAISEKKKSMQLAISDSFGNSILHPKEIFGSLPAQSLKSLKSPKSQK